MKTRNALLCASILLGAPAIIAFAGVASPSSAAPLQETGGYYMEAAGKNCAATNYCGASFSKIPAGNFLLVTGVSCYVASNNNTPIHELYFLGNSLPTYLAPVAVGANGTTFYWQANAVTSVFVTSALAPSVAVSWISNTNSQIDCTISGQLKAH